MTADERDLQAFGPSIGVKLRVNSLDGFDSHVDTMLDEFRDWHRVEAPAHDGLMNSLLCDFEVGGNQRQRCVGLL